MDKVAFSMPSLNVTTSPRSEQSINTVLILCALAYVTVSLTAIVGNMYGLFKILRIIKRIQGRVQEKTPLRKANLMLLLHMSISDLLAGTFAMPFTALTMVLSAVGYQEHIFVVHVLLCNLSGFIQCTVCRMSLFITMILVMIRALAIFSSRTVSHASMYRVIQYSVYISWAMCVFISVTPFLRGKLFLYNRNLEMGWWDLAQVFGKKGVTVGYLLIDVIPFLIPGAIVIVCTGIVLYGLRMLAKVEKDVKSKRTNSHYQATITTLMVVGTFITCYGMWWITSLVVFFNMAGIIERVPEVFRIKEDQPNVVFMLSHGFLVYLNSAINPILYHFRLFNNTKSRDGRSSVSSSTRKNTILRKTSTLSMSRISTFINRRDTVQEEIRSSSIPTTKSLSPTSSKRLPTSPKQRISLTAVPKTLFNKTFKSFSRGDLKAEQVGVEHCMVNQASECSIVLSQDGGMLEELSSEDKVPNEQS